MFSMPVIEPGQQRVEVTVEGDEAGGRRCFEAVVRIDTPNEFSCFANGGILQYVLRRIAAG